MNKILIILVLINFAFMNEYEDVLYLENGSIIRGVIIEQVINDYVKIKSGKNILVYNFNEIIKIEKSQTNVDYNIENDLSTSYQTIFESNKTTLLATYITTALIGELVIKEEYNNDHNLLLPIIGPFLQMRVVGDSYYSKDYYKSRDQVLLGISGTLQIISLLRMLKMKKNINNLNDNFSFNLVPYRNNTAFSLEFKF